MSEPPENARPKPPPHLGLAARSGTGKTTLLRRLIPLLVARGLRLGLIKHAHHDFDIDHPGKDSHELRKAGADRVLVASRRRRALIIENPEEREPRLEDLLAEMGNREIDLILVEGFKHVDFPKIELHRPETGDPLLGHEAPGTIAIATTADAVIPSGLHRLSLDDIDAMASFIIEWRNRQSGHATPGKPS